MKRTLLALALAGASFAASALPPPGAGAPVNVNVTNPVLQVEVSNSEPIPVTTMEPDLYSREVVGTCPSDYSCFASFPQVPAGKRLLITNVRYLAVAPSAGGYFEVARGMVRVLAFAGTWVPPQFHSGTHVVQLVYEAGETPVLYYTTSSPVYEPNIRFGLTGYLMDAM